ncbi:type II glyceraldehyde-3-phosphate dehydrogenase [Candidatus Woesearchaeota archaeon]|nr:type II glyceraldehyde-3-phosphate dehydrogenase [Candidatus Woesearchaeota archaeon]MBI2550185.1 type II glyceraldehyde-3-phosphate dehydrogenase [Candidatus Woesearchaeota archaeon]
MLISKLRIGINGYGTIGRRVADAVMKQPDMDIVGVTKATADYRVDEAQEKGIKVFCLNESDRKQFDEAGYYAEGSLKELLDGCDAVVDCAPKGKGKENLAIYSNYPGLKSVFQGGEKHDLTGFSFNSDCNFELAAGKRFLRVVSCNTTALCRIISTLNTSFQIRKVRATLVRRSSDQSESEKSVLNAWVPETSKGFPSHHSADVRTIMPGLKITTLAGEAPMTLMHGHMLFIEMENCNATAEAVTESLKQNPRILLCSTEKGLTSTAKLKDLFSLNGRNGNLYEVCVWKEGIGVDPDGEIGLHMAIDQQADVVPENIDAIRAMFGTMPAEESIALTNASLGIGKIVKNVAYVRK